MHNNGLSQPYTTVEAYGVHHIIVGNNSFMTKETKEDVESIVSKVLKMETGSKEQNDYLTLVLNDYYFNKNKYELTHLIRSFVLARFVITYKNVPFFRIIVRDFSPVVREARSIDPITVLKN